MMSWNHFAKRVFMLAFCLVFSALGLAPAAFGQGATVELVGELDLPGTVGKILLEGDRLYVQANDVGVCIVDVSDPTAPALLGTIVETGISDFAVKDQYVYVTRRSNVMRIIDSADPKDLLEKNELTFGNHNIPSVIIIDNTMILNGFNDSDIRIVSTFDISDATTPIIRDTVTMDRSNDARDHFVDSGEFYAFVSTSCNTWLFDKAALPEIKIAGYDSVGVAGGLTVTHQMMAIGLIMNVRYSCRGIRVYDFHNPSAQVIRGAYYTKEDVNALASDGWLVYAANDTAGLRIFDISDPAYPKVVAEYATEDAANDVILHKGLAYVSTSSDIKILRYTGGQPVLEQNAVATSHTVPYKLIAGQSVSASVSVRNTGQTTWYEPEFKLALLNEDSPLWVYDFPRLHLDNGDPVTPGETFTFTLPLKAPSQPGLYTMELQMIEEHVEFFGDKLSVVVEVIANSQAQQASWSPYE